MTTGKWVRGPYAPVDQEVEVFDLEVIGSIPPELNGMLTRIGPNPIPPHAEDHNLFAGDGMVHAMTLSNGKATSYKNRWVRTEDVSRKLGETPVADPVDRQDTSNTHIVPFAGKLYAMTEACIPYQLDSSLKTIMRDTFDGDIAQGFTAHPHTDPVTGRLHAIGFDVNAETIATHFVIEPDGSLGWKTDIQLGGSSWIHDFAMTENFAIIWDMPLQHRQELQDAGEQAPYKWDPDYPTRVGIRPLNAKTPDVRWFDLEPCFVFHAVNAWEVYDEAGGLSEIICDVVQFAKMFDEDRTGPGDAAPPQLHRWVFNMKTGQMTDQMIDQRIQEYPRIDDRYWGKPSSFAVTTELFNSDGGSGLIVHDGRGNASSYGFEERVVASEGVFVPASETADEGEGWILTFGVHAQTGASKASVFDATKVSDGPVGEIILPQRVPVTFHGSWIPEATL
ncbi:carotenoid oxygenase family protein [Pyruvatibacter sp.]